MKRGGFLQRRAPIKAKVGIRRGTVRLKKKRQDSVGKLKAQLWELCRQIVFRRYQNKNGEVFCFTSGQGPLTGSNRHLGHFIPSSVGGVGLRFDLDNLRPQSYVENVHKSGNWPAYYANLVAEIGQEKVDALLARKHQTVKADSIWYREKIAEYSALLSGL